MKLFINYSNHPTSKWGEDQLNAAKEMADRVVDEPFPQINPEATEFDVVDLAKSEINRFFQTYSGYEELVIHIAGEMTFVAYFVSQINKWWAANAICITSTTKRDVVENEDGSKIVKFKFVRFRQYLTI
jgi:hypothetical protein